MHGLPKLPALYEAMYILDSALDAEARQQIVETLEGHVTTLGGEVVATREFGARRLAFEINGHRDGVYMILYFKGFVNVVEELKHEIRMLDSIIRSVIVVANPKAIFDPTATAAPAATEETAEEGAADEAASEEAAIEEAPAEAAAEEAAPEEAPAEAEAAPAEAVAAVEEPVAAEETETPAETTDEA